MPVDKRTVAGTLALDDVAQPNGDAENGRLVVEVAVVAVGAVVVGHHVAVAADDDWCGRRTRYRPRLLPIRSDKCRAE